jgi:hypothetical protein
MRASDEDREAVTERLRQAAGEGRLLAHELEERLARALRARTYGELDATVADLPGGLLTRRSRSRELVRAHPIAAVAIIASTAVVVAVVVAVILAWFLMAWGLWLVIALVVMARRSHGVQPGPPHSGRLGARPHAGWDRRL